MRKVINIIAVQLLVLLFWGHSAALAGTQEDMLGCSKDNTSFALDLYEQLREDEGNVFFSPFSISTAFAIAYAGARGNTGDEMAEVLHFSLTRESLHPAFSELSKTIEALQQKGSLRLHVANALWVQKGSGLNKDFLDIVNQYYGAEPVQLDFINKMEKSRRRINKWVEKKTHGKIKDLLSKRGLNRFTRLVLTNAIYFKGHWETQFDKKNTKVDAFYVAANRKVNVYMMYQKNTFGYKENESVQVLELPYKGRDVSMLVFLPRDGFEIEDTEKGLKDNLAEWTENLYPREVSVYFPRFKITKSFSMVKTFQKMGMRDAFNDNADFTGMVATRPFPIASVIHKAFVEVNEEGTEAAAATGIIFGTVSLPPPPAVFRADHPFVFIIKENKTGSILFMGRVSDPAQNGE